MTSVGHLDEALATRISSSRESGGVGGRGGSGMVEGVGEGEWDGGGREVGGGGPRQQSEEAEWRRHPILHNHASLNSSLITH